MKKTVKQNIVAEQELNEDGKLVKDWGKGEWKISVELDVICTENCGLVAGIEAKDCSYEKNGSRREKVTYVRGREEMYRKIMDERWKDSKREDRSRRCDIKGKRGKLIRCPETIIDPVTGNKVYNSCEKCPYYNNLDKPSFSVLPFSFFDTENGNILDNYIANHAHTLINEAERYVRLVGDLLADLNEKDPVLAKIIFWKISGMSQREVGEQVGLSQQQVGRILEKFRPEFDKFLENIIY